MIKRWFQNAPIKRKQMFIIMLTTGVALLLACAAFITRDALVFRRELVGRLSSLAEVIGNNCAAAIDFDDAAAAAQTLMALEGESSVVLARVHTRDGRPLVAYLRPGSAMPVAIPAHMEAYYEFRGDHLHLFRPIVNKGEQVGTIQVIATLEEFRAGLWRNIGIVGAVFALSLGVAFWLSNRLQRVVSGPILHLAGVARQVAQEQNYALRAARHGADELGQLIDGFNEMLTQIQQRDAALESAREQLETRVQERTTELAASLSLLNATLDATADGILALDLNGRAVCHNRQFLELWQLPPEIMRDPDGIRRRDLIMSQLKEPGEFQEWVRDVEAGRFEESHGIKELKDGRTFEEFVKPQMVEGRCIGLVINVGDITERRRAEAKLAEASRLMDSLLAGSQDFIYFKDRESRFVRYSRSLAEHLHLADPEALAGRTDFDFYAEDRARMAFEDEQQIIRTGHPILGKLESGILTDGRMTWVLTSKMPWRDAAGTIIGTFGISKDVTALKEAEHKLAYERELVRSLMDNSEDFIYFKDKESKFIRGSLALARQFKLNSAEELTGRSDFDFFTEEHARPAFDDEQEIMRTGRPIIAKMERETWPDGRVTWATTSKMPLRNAQGEIVGTFGISREVTAMKEAEAKLEEVHKQLIQASRQAGMAEVATGVLHNVGNVLNSINVSTSVLGDQVKKSKCSSVARVAGLMREHEHDLGEFITRDPRGSRLPAYMNDLAAQLEREQAETLKELAALEKNVAHIKDIVAMQQSYAKVSGVSQMLQAVNVVEDALRMNSTSLIRHEVELVREYASDLPEFIGDQHKILQILVNLLQNAKHACDDYGREEKRITVQVRNGSGCIHFSVIDNGMGIPAENLNRIFNHGFTTRKEGHGFGLHSGALAAHEMGGRLTVQSDGPGKGATFTLELPLAPPGNGNGNPEVKT